MRHENFAFLHLLRWLVSRLYRRLIQRRLRLPILTVSLRLGLLVPKEQEGCMVQIIVPCVGKSIDTVVMVRSTTVGHWVAFFCVYQSLPSYDETKSNGTE